MKIHHVHDAGFKALYLIKEIALVHIQKFLDDEITSELDYADFSLEPTTYLDEKLRQSFSDIVYSCSLKNGQNAKIVFLFEHKSYATGHPHLQVGRYIFNILEQAFTQENGYPIVIPIILYHGDAVWKYKKLSDYFQNLPAFAKRFLPDFEIVITDLKNYPDDFLLKLLKDKLLLNALLALKHGGNQEYVVKHFNQIMVGIAENIEKEMVRHLFYIISVYLSDVSNLSVSQLSALFKNISKKDVKMTAKILEEIKSKSPSELLGIEMDLLKKYQEAERAERLRAAVERELEKAEVEKRKAQEREKQAQKERKQAQKERQQAQKERQQAQQTIIDTVLTLSIQYKYNVATIAAIVKKPVTFIERILETNK